MIKRTIFLSISVILLFSNCLTAQPGKTNAVNNDAGVKNKTWYVSGNGSDDNDGTTLSKAFATLQKAANIVQPGETVLVGNGKYKSNDKTDGGALLKIVTSGRPRAWITWKALPGHKPELCPTGWAGINIGASYQVIDGLQVTGANDSIVLLKALDQAKVPQPDAYYNTNGIVVDGRRNGPALKPHHVVIKNCTVSKCPGGGITMLEGDYLTIEDCKIFENAWYMRYAGSGITTLNNWAFDDLPGYHVIIQRNMVWNNKTLVPWERTGKLSDGNGILLDVTDQATGATNPNADSVIGSTAKPDEATAKPKRPEWKGRALIANNLSVYNGGSGIHTFRTSHVDIINNTTYWNGQTVGYQELFPNRSDDIVILNNIIVPRPGGKITSDNRNTNIRWDYNVYPVEQKVFKGGHDVVADPKFINANIDVMVANFSLAAGSPALNSGTKDLAQPMDVTKKKRPQGNGIDKGCYEQ